VSAKDHLSIQLFHGTNVPFKTGDVVSPMGDMGASWQEDFPETGDYAHATYDPEYAKVFADRAHEEFGEDIGNQSRPRIYRVEPIRGMEKDPTAEHAGWRSKEGFRVLGLHAQGIPSNGGYRGFQKP